MVAVARRYKKPPPVGTYLCPLCGSNSRTEVKDSRPGRHGYPRRRRYCNNCKGNFSTIEIPEKMLDNFDVTALASVAAEALSNAVNKFNTLRRAIKAAAVNEPE